MKMNAGVVCAALEWVLDCGAAAPADAMPLRLVRERWQVTHLRSSDLGAAIEMLAKRRRISVESRSDGLWLRRGQAEAKPAGVGLIRGLVRELMFRRTLHQMLRRHDDASYAGENRRRPGVAAQI